MKSYVGFSTSTLLTVSLESFTFDISLSFTFKKDLLLLCLSIVLESLSLFEFSLRFKESFSSLSLLSSITFCKGDKASIYSLYSFEVFLIELGCFDVTTL